jgi:hypothetical protein
MGVYVEAGGGDASVFERGQERLFVDELAARRHDDAQAALGPGQRLLADEVPALPRERGVEGDEVRGLHQLVQGEHGDVLRLRDGGGHEGVEGGDVHPEGAGTRAYFRPMRPKPTTPRRLPDSSTPGKALRSQRSAFMAASAWATLRATREEEGQGQLRRGHEVPHRRVHHHDAEARRRLEVHVVDADPGRPDDLQVLARLQHLRRDLAAAADGHGVVGADDPRQLRGGIAFCWSICQPSAFRSCRPRSVMPSRTRSL